MDLGQGEGQDPGLDAGQDAGPDLGQDAVLFDACSTLLEVDTLRWEHQLARMGWPVFGLHEAVWQVTTRSSHHATPTPDSGPGPAWLDELSLTTQTPREVLATSWAEQDAVANLWGRAIPGAAACLASLAAAGRRLSVVSNADGRIADALELAGLDRFFEVIIDSAIVEVAKPDPAIFAHAMTGLGLPADRLLYVGDSAVFDVPAAEGAGISCWLLDHTGTMGHQHPQTVTSFPALLGALGVPALRP